MTKAGETMDVNIGDIYIRHSDGKLWRVKSIQNKKVVLESLDGVGFLTMTDIFGLQKAFAKRDPNSSSPLNSSVEFVSFLLSSQD